MTAPADNAPAESLDDRIVRLRQELADAELDKAGDELGSVAGEFISIMPDFWEKDCGLPLPTIDELKMATAICKEAWDRFVAWQGAWRKENAAKAEQRPYLALPAVPRVMLPSGRSPAGAGSVYASGNGFKWRLSRDGKLIASRTWPTREEAEAELALAAADSTFVPAARDRKRLGITSTCSRCGSTEHQAPKCPRAPVDRIAPGLRARMSSAGEEAGCAAIAAGASITEAMSVARAAAEAAGGPLVSSANAEAAPISMPADASSAGEDAGRAATEKDATLGETPGGANGATESVLREPSIDLSAIPRFSIAEEIEDEGNRKAAATRRERQIQRHLAANPEAPSAEDEEVEEEEENDTPGWSEPDADGRQTCIPCDGEGIDTRPGPGAGNCCLNCDGEGYRWTEETGRQTA